MENGSQATTEQLKVWLQLWRRDGVFFRSSMVRAIHGLFSNSLADDGRLFIGIVPHPKESSISAAAVAAVACQRIGSCGSKAGQ